MRAPILLLLIAALSPIANAQTTFTLQPAQTMEGEAVDLRTDDPSGCVFAPQIDMERAGDLVTVEIHETDAGPCLPEWATPRFVPLGTFTLGTYQVKAFLCGNAPPPEPECQLRATLALTVFGSIGTRFIVPVLSSAVMLGLAFAAMVLGARFATRK